MRVPLSSFQERHGNMQLPRDGKRDLGKQRGKERSKQASKQKLLPISWLKKGNAHFEDGRKEGRETNGWKK